MCFKKKSILFGCFYRPPEGSRYLRNDHDDLIAEQLKAVNKLNKEVIVMGDFNVNYLNATNKDFKTTINTLGYKQIVTTATRTTENSSTLIDIILTNTATNISEVSVFALSLSDHDMVVCTRKVNRFKFEPQTIKCRNYSHYNENDFCDDVKNINWTSLESINDVNSALNFFNTTLGEIFDKHAPIIRKKVKGKPCKWLTRELKGVMNNRDKQLRKARKQTPRTTGHCIKCYVIDVTT